MILNTHQVEHLQKALTALNASSDTVIAACDTYLSLLQKWNIAYNLTAIHDTEEMVARHLLDSLVMAPWLTGTSIIDVGTGPGLPGIPLALACPQKKIVLLDSNGKKTRFLAEVQRHLKLPNIEIVHARVERYQPLQRFDTVISRAFAQLQTMLEQTQHLLIPGGEWIALKGQNVMAELTHFAYPYHLIPYQIPGIEGERYGVVVKNESSSRA